MTFSACGVYEKLRILAEKALHSLGTLRHIPVIVSAREKIPPCGDHAGIVPGSCVGTSSGRQKIDVSAPRDIV